MLIFLFSLAVAQERHWHYLSLLQATKTQQTHICTVGPVVYVRKQQDGDWHITLDDGKAKLVVEIIPQLPLPVPKKGDRIEVCGIHRYDEKHNWPEIHPAEVLTVRNK